VKNCSQTLDFQELRKEDVQADVALSETLTQKMEGQRNRRRQVMDLRLGIGGFACA
jgi:hypothetical protein